MDRIFDKVKRDIPFNDFTSAMRMKGEVVPEEMGGNCFHQAKILIEGLRAAGYEAYYLPDINECHVAAVAQESGRWYFFDPFLLHDEPICLSDLNSEPKSFEAIPDIEGRPTLINANRYSDNDFLIVRKRWMKGLGDYEDDETVWARRFCLADACEEFEPLEPEKTRRAARVGFKKPDVDGRRLLVWKMIFAAAPMALHNGNIGYLYEGDKADSTYHPELYERRLEDLAHDLGIGLESMKRVVARSERLFFHAE